MSEILSTLKNLCLYTTWIIEAIIYRIKGDINIYCLFGIHKWKQNREIHITDIHTMFKLSELTRKCDRCGKQQYWLSGCGGSEIGSWEVMRNE